MKKMFIVTIMILMLMAVPAFALDLGYSISSSDFDKSTGNSTSGVATSTDSFHAVGVLGSGTISGNNFAGGQAVTTHTPPFIPGGWIENGNGTQNFGEAIGGFDFSIKTGNKNFLWVIPPVAGAIAGTKGDVSQWSDNWSNISGFNGVAGSQASQGSAAGFIGADAALLIGKNKGPVTGLFTGDSVVNGYSFSISYKGQIGDTKYIGAESGAGNSAETIITGGIGSGYAGGNGQTSGQSSIDGTHGFTSGVYSGQFSYSGNGSGNVFGYTQSYNTQLPHGAIFGTSSGVSINK